MSPLLRKARLIWAKGEPIDTHLAMRLAALGFDVPALELRYLR